MGLAVRFRFRFRVRVRVRVRDRVRFRFRVGGFGLARLPGRFPGSVWNSTKRYEMLHWLGFS